MLICLFLLPLMTRRPLLYLSDSLILRTDDLRNVVFRPMPSVFCASNWLFLRFCESSCSTLRK